jgi:uncharacterized ion transporter superfamily protein YfcC
MSEKHAGATISARAFSQSVFILLALMLAAGILTRVLPAGSFTRVERAGRQVIVPGSYQTVPRPDYAPWRWLTAPLEVLGGPDALVLITIAVFILLVGGALLCWTIRASCRLPWGASCARLGRANMHCCGC